MRADHMEIFAFFTAENLFSPWPKVSQSWWPGLELQHTAHCFSHVCFMQECVPGCGVEIDIIIIAFVKEAHNVGVKHMSAVPTFQNKS